MVRFENDLVILEPGDDIFVFRLVTINDQEISTFTDFERRPVLVIVAALFVALLLLFAGWHGVRSLISLLVSVAAVIFVLAPPLLAGYPPVLTSIGVAGVVLAMVPFGTHGFNPRGGEVALRFGGKHFGAGVRRSFSAVDTPLRQLTNQH